METRTSNSYDNNYGTQASTSEGVDVLCHNAHAVSARAILSSGDITKTNISADRNVQVVPANALATYIVDNDKRIKTPDELPPTTNRNFPKIKIKALKELQEPEIYEKTEKKLEKMQELNKQYDSIGSVSFQAHVIVRDIEEIYHKTHLGENEAFNNNTTSNDNEIEQTTENTLSTASKHISTAHTTEPLLIARHVLTSYLKKQQEFLRTIDDGNNGGYPPLVRKLETEKFLDLSNANNDSTIIEISNPKVHEEIEENKKVNGQNPDQNYETVHADEITKVADISALKEGIIESSRTLINTQKTLKVFTEIVCKDVCQNQQAINLITKFQNTLKSFRKRIDELGKNVKNEYKHLLPNTDIDSILKSIDESQKRNEMPSFHKSIRRKRAIESSVVSDCIIDNSNKAATGRLIDIGSKNSEGYSTNENVSGQVNISDDNYKKKVKVRVIQSNWYNSKKKKLSEISTSTVEITDFSPTNASLRLIRTRSCRK